MLRFFLCVDRRYVVVGLRCFRAQLGFFGSRGWSEVGGCCISLRCTGRSRLSGGNVGVAACWVNSSFQAREGASGGESDAEVDCRPGECAACVLAAAVETENDLAVGAALVAGVRERVGRREVLRWSVVAQPTTRREAMSITVA